MPGDDALAAELRRLERERRTGVLSVGDGGAFHLAEGAVVYAESTRTAGLEAMARASGRAVPEDRAAAVAALGAPLLEAMALLATFDAACLLLDPDVEPDGRRARFREGPPHWLAPFCRITPATLAHEQARRRDLLGAPEAVDRCPVVPVRRVRRQRVILTGLQAEVLLNADGRRTPVELARDLGRSAFGCVLAVRALRDGGLVEAPPGEAPSVGAERLPRRRAASREAAPAEPPGRWEPVDHDVLVRLRRALEELA
ncbi:hypothetical protein [Actinomadura kijaniata]|uniref:hypothetical protein n=1 Tax=Actinomadura kijaniata TaxID=46161 RepID=UPI00082C53F0|nr:hypothetical protein [Actinomadura kijaniata]